MGWKYNLSPVSDLCSRRPGPRHPPRPPRGQASRRRRPRPRRQTRRRVLGREAAQGPGILRPRPSDKWGQAPASLWPPRVRPNSKWVQPLWVLTRRRECGDLTDWQQPGSNTWGPTIMMSRVSCYKVRTQNCYVLKWCKISYYCIISLVILSVYKYTQRILYKLSFKLKIDYSMIRVNQGD